MSKFKCLCKVIVGKPGERLFVRCGECTACLNFKRAQKQAQLIMETQQHRDRFSSFILLTFDDANLPDPELDEEEQVALADWYLTSFLKRLRMSYFRQYGGKLRFFAALERGNTGSKRLHWHILIFGVNPILFNRDFKSCWPYGMCNAKMLTAGTIGYVTKYLYKERELSVRFSLGLGYDAMMTMLYRDFSRKCRPNIDYFVPSYFRPSGSKAFFPFTSYFRRKALFYLLNRGFSVIKADKSDLFFQTSCLVNEYHFNPGTRLQQVSAWWSDFRYRYPDFPGDLLQPWLGIPSRSTLQRLFQLAGRAV